MGSNATFDEMYCLYYTVSQSVSLDFTVPPRAHPSTGSQSGSATPGLTQVPSTRSRGLLNYVASEVNLSTTNYTGIHRVCRPSD